MKFLSRSLMLLICMSAGVFLTYVLTLAGLMVFAGTDLSGALVLMSDSLSAMRWMQLLQNVLVFILPAFLVARFVRRRPSDVLALSKGVGPLGLNILLAAVSMAAALPLVNVLAQWNEGWHLPEALAGLEQTLRAYEDAAAVATERLLSGTTVASLLLNVFIIAFMAALSEEILFRGTVMRLLGEAFTRHYSSQRGVSPKASHAAIWVTAMIFSAFHIQFFGFIPRMLMGVWLGYLLWWTRSLWVPMAAHFANNALAVFYAWLEQRGIMPEDSADAWGTGPQAWMCAVSAAVLLGCIFYYRRVSKS